MKPLLLLSDVAALRRKLAQPPPLLANCYARFQRRLADDAAFRQHHIFLPALLGDPVALAEAKARIMLLAQDPLRLCQERPGAGKKPPSDTLDNHVWCIAPRAMRLAAYTSWLEVHGAWAPAERYQVGRGLLDFIDQYVVPVLRARVPGGHNQQLSMTFCSTVVGHVFADEPGLAARARALRDWALPKFKQVLGLLPASGYSGEGSTYQSDVVSPLSMWAGVFLAQLGEPEVWQRTWEPGGWRVAATLQMESEMGSCGGLLPPWDQYGWQRIHNLSVRTLWAALTRNSAWLQVAEACWDEPHQLAWWPDDRLWTILYWPEQEDGAAGRAVPHGDIATADHPQVPRAVLTGWSHPAVGAAVEHRPRRLRVMTVWDRCAGGLQELGRGHVDPNHLIVELDGRPVTEDGVQWKCQEPLAADARQRTLQTLTPAEQAMIIRQYGTLDDWLKQQQMGFLGRACSVVVDGWESYFPRSAREGALLFERREPDRHCFASEAAAFYQPALDVTRMRRTVSMNAAGVTWVVDEIRAQSAHAFTWRAWLRRGARVTGVREVQVEVSAGAAMTWAWWVETDGGKSDAAVALTTTPDFPAWTIGDSARSELGSERCDITASGRVVRFITCLIPACVTGVSLRPLGSAVWEACWPGGVDVFTLPPEIAAMPDLAPATDEGALQSVMVCDLDETPYALLAEPEAALLAALDDPPVTAWRRTGAVMQTLTMRGVPAALPKIQDLLLDARQNYTVHSVAAWCLGHARYQPARATLQQLQNIPEVNTAMRARWAVERMGPAHN
jgi:hypothetical protein